MKIGILRRISNKHRQQHYICTGIFSVCTGCPTACTHAALSCPQAPVLNTLYTGTRIISAGFHIVYHVHRHPHHVQVSCPEALVLCTVHRHPHHVHQDSHNMYTGPSIIVTLRYNLKLVE